MREPNAAPPQGALEEPGTRSADAGPPAATRSAAAEHRAPDAGPQAMSPTAQSSLTSLVSLGAHAAPSARPAPGSATVPQLGEPERRMAWLMFLRTLVVSGVLGLTLWLSAAQSPSRASVWLLSSIIATTYLLNVLFGLLLRRGQLAADLVHWQLSGELVINSLLVYVTGGAQSPYTFLFALTVVGAGALLYRRGALVVTVASLVLLISLSLLLWYGVALLPMAAPLRPWDLSTNELARALGINIGGLIGVGALAVLFGDQLQRTAQSLASERRAVADLYTLHRDIVRSLTSGLITIDGAGKVLTVNATAAELLEVDPEAALGEPIDALLPGLSERLGSDHRGELRRVDLEVPRPSEPLTLGVSVSPLFNVHDEVIGRVVHFQDLTNLRRMEVHMRRADRLATVGQLAAGIAHEIRNPLASISGSIELLRQAPQASEDDRSLMTIVTREIDRLNTLITDLLDYANPRPSQAMPFDLAALLDETVQMARQDRDDVELALEMSERPLELVADAAKLRQVIWNLVHNARDAARDGGGHVIVRAQPSASLPGFLELLVIDDGPGMPPDVQKRIFDPFFTTKRKGTGLGLATCHGIVTDHRGRIDVESAPGSGTSVRVLLPRTPADAAASPRTVGPTERIRRATIDHVRRGNTSPLPRQGPSS